jgi:hypothetical protein
MEVTSMIPMFIIIGVCMSVAFIVDGAASALTAHSTVCKPCTEAKCDESDN